MILIERNQKSTLKPIIERVFSRKKRWMIFPKGANLKFTLNVSKRLLAMYPKGFNFVFEAAVYYPMPSARIDLIPKRFRKPTTKAPAPTGTTPLYLIGIPGSLIKYRAKPATKPAKVQRIDQDVSLLKWISSPSLSPSLYHNNSVESKWHRYSLPKYLKNNNWSLEKQQKYVDKYSTNNYNKWSKWATKSRPSQPIYTGNNKWYQRQRFDRNVDDNISSLDNYNDVLEYEPIYFEDLERFEDSPHYHSYRCRRELFHHFEGLSKILGIDMKSCILRAVCDSKRFLLPPGYSMVQDILRVVFTFPTISGLNDEYTRIMKADYETCDAQLHNKCPLSILDWLLNSKK
ncbi:uncharacterized protein ACRADG_009167 [Cochliomyia hominivorax]